MIFLYCRGEYALALRIGDVWICASCGEEVRNVVG